MNRSLVVRRTLLGVGALLLILIAGIVFLGVALDTGHLRGPVTRFISARAGRPVTFGGALDIHMLSLHPRLTAERVTVGNPPWVAPGATAELGTVSLVLTDPWFGRPVGIEKLEIQDATLHLARDAAGHANWQWSPPGTQGGHLMPIIRSLTVSDAHVELDDERRHLQFRGIVSLDERGSSASTRPLRIVGEGQLNGRSATFQIDGEPLAAASHAAPYHFTFTEHSNGTQLDGRGSLLHPFDFGQLDAEFKVTGPDLKDLYFLTGVTLIDTGAYHLSGNLARRGRRSVFSDLAVASGQSDMRGTVAIETADGRPQIEADLNSQLLRLADLGARAAGRAPEAGPPLLLSKATFNPVAARRADGTINFHARQVEIGRESLQAVAAKLTLDHGILVLAPLTGGVLEGRFSVHARIDATADDPAVALDLSLKDAQLGQLARKDSTQPPMEGLLQVRVVANGHGTSLHQAAASADGTVTAVIPGGLLRASLAELTGVDLRGVGLLLAKSTRETPVHCGVASFRAHEGTLTAQSLVIDTDSVLITGDGTIRLDTEALDLTLRGRPKSLRLLRVRSPMLVRGTLTHPSAGIQAGGSLVFVDPGQAQDADCAGLLAAARAQESAPGAPAPATRNR